MDVRQKHIVPLDGRQSDFAEKDDTSADGREDNEKQSSSPTLLMDDTPDFVATSQSARPSASIPYLNRDREAMTFVRWQLPSRMPREVMNFDRTMEELMEQERFPAIDNLTPRYPYHAKNIAAIEAIQVLVRQRSPASRHGSETLPRVNSDHDQGAVGTMQTRQIPSRGDADGRTRGQDDHFDYNRLLPPEPRPRGIESKNFDGSSWYGDMAQVLYRDNTLKSWTLSSTEQPRHQPDLVDYGVRMMNGKMCVAEEQ